MSATPDRHPSRVRSPRGLAVAVACSIAGPALGGAPVVPVHRLVEVGDPVSGQGPGVVFEAIQEHPFIFETSSPDPPPAHIDDDGAVTFQAIFGAEGLPPNPFVEPIPRTGVFRVFDGAFALVAETNTNAPGAGTDFIGFPIGMFPRPPMIDEGAVLIQGGTGENPFAAEVGFWIEHDGRLDLVARVGDMLPGMPSDGAMSAAAFARQHGPTTYLWTEFTSSQIGDIDPNGLWRLSDTGVEPIAVNDTQAPGFAPGIVFGEPTFGHVFGSVGTFGTSNGGNVAITGSVKGSSITLDNDEAIWVDTGQGLEVFLKENDAPPPGLFAPGATFHSGSSINGTFTSQSSPPIRINDAGQLLFFAEVDIPGAPPRVPSLWTTRGGALDLVLRGSLRSPVAFAEPGDPAPGIPGATFFHTMAADLSGDGDLFVFALVEMWPEWPASMRGVWVDQGDGLTVVGYEGGPVEAIPGATFIDPVGSALGFVSARMEPDGSIIYVALFEERTGIELGLFRHTPDGLDEVLLRTDGLVTFDGMTEPVSFFQLGNGMADDGTLVARIFFPDGGQGLFTLGGPPPVLIGDLDGNGIVNFADVLQLLAAWGPCVDCPADLDGDGVVGFSDVLLLLANWS